MRDPGANQCLFSAGHTEFQSRSLINQEKGVRTMQVETSYQIRTPSFVLVLHMHAIANHHRIHCVVFDVDKLTTCIAAGGYLS